MLLRYRPTVRTEVLELPDGSTRKVKVTTDETRTVQHVEDGDVQHGTGRVLPTVITVRTPSKRRGVLRNLGMPRMRQAFSRDDGRLWTPVPGTEQLR